MLNLKNHILKGHKMRISKCKKCGGTFRKAHLCRPDKDTGYLPDTRPQRHDGSEPATDRVLKDMATEDALDEMNW